MEKPQAVWGSILLCEGAHPTQQINSCNFLTISQCAELENAHQAQALVLQKLQRENEQISTLKVSSIHFILAIETQRLFP